ncbi:MAG: hypothetical protein OSJ72_09205 [Lachnospiraceae bacterium]|nr:hypothetical protein [Lachnospiraceae bacterium]
MGKMIKVTCTSCKGEWECMTGCGISHALLQDVVREFPQEIGDKIRKENGEEFPIFDFGYQLSVCGDCRNAVSVPVLRFDEKDVEYMGPCPVCRGKAALVTDLEDAVCPVCGKKTLTAEETGSWD